MSGSASRPLRVALVSYDFGGYCISLANGLAGRGVEVLLVLSDEQLDPLRELVSPAVEVARFAKPRLRKPLRQVRLIAELAGVVRRFDADVVHLQQGQLWLNLGLALGALSQRPRVVTIHDHGHHPGDRGSARTPLRVMAIPFRRADRAIVHAQQLRDEVRARGLVAPERIHVIPHVAVADAFTDTTGAPGERPTELLFFGRIWPYKGLDHLIRAEPLVAARVPGVHTVIAGRGEDLQRYRELMADPARFELHEGYVPDEQRAELFDRAAVVVLPYVEATQSGVVPVAYAHGKPVVATRVGGLPEIVDDGETGLLVPAGDEGALADAIVRLLEDEPLRHRLGANGRAKLESELSPQAVARGTVAVYESAVEGRLAIPPPLVPTPHGLLDAALRLERHLVRSHVRAGELSGPDCGVRLNYRASRFVKSVLPRLPWNDNLYYLQGQAYWMLGCLRGFELTGDEQLRAAALTSARAAVARQRPDGAWEYPNPAWRGRIATAEGTWAALGLLAVHAHEPSAALLEAVLRWAGYVEHEIGYQRAPGGLAVNYFVGRTGAAVPNNAAFQLRFLAALAEVTGDDAHLARCADLLGFLAAAQRPSGELPYEVASEGGEPRLPHFQCYQYNAFQLLDLLAYARLSGDAAAQPVIAGLARYLRWGVAPDGHARYACAPSTRRIVYHAGALAAALHEAAAAGYEGCAGPSARAYAWLLEQQRPDGAFPFSRGDYGVLRDTRSYPRSQAMILFHLLSGVDDAG
jgi:glycosyltransferase involved in cell wall biosynthesis